MSKLTQYRYAIIERSDIPANEIFEQKCDELGVTASVDYVANAVNELEARKQLVKDGKKQLALAEKEIDAEILRIKEGVAVSLVENDVPKLTGLTTSSITLDKATEKEDISTKKFVTKLTKDEINQLIFDAGQGYYEVEVTTRESKPATIRINKKR